MEGKMTVTSELYEEKPYISGKKPSFNKNNVVSKFRFKTPPQKAEEDDDGDLDVTRRRDVEVKIIEIEHSNKTEIDLVGLQIWRGALLLADWLLYNKDRLVNSTVLELGSGVGLTSIVASIIAPVICTDISKGGILELIHSNIERNKSIVKHPVSVTELDFTSDGFSADIEKILPSIDIILAADVIYDNDLTEAFVQTLYKLIKKSKTAYLAMEKRYVFTIEDCDTVAPCYEYFIRCMDNLERTDNKVQADIIPLNFPQYFEYERTKQLVMWKVTYNCINNI